MKTIKEHINLLKFIIILPVFLFSGIFDLIPILLLNINVDTLSDEGVIAVILFRQTLVTIIIFLLYHKDLKKQFKDFKLNAMKYLDEGLKYWVLGLVIMGTANYLIMQFTPDKMANNEEAVRSMINAAPYLTIILTGVFAPFIEEMVFRKAFKDIFNNKWMFILSSGIVFGSLHILGEITSLYNFLYLIPYSALGISFAYMHYKTNNIYTSIIMHCIHNTIISVLTISGLGMILW